MEIAVATLVAAVIAALGAVAMMVVLAREGVEARRRRLEVSFLCPKGHEDEAQPGPLFCRECGEEMRQVPPRACPNGHRADRWQNFCHRCGHRVPSLQEEDAILRAAAR